MGSDDMGYSLLQQPIGQLLLLLVRKAMVFFTPMYAGDEDIGAAL